ncbi:hypothetical protein BDN70DRAFT_873933 [Pholiota conissans]|uniref:Uncharacterized protein n=1 Tax=Pholiota conissans TaxID=109636 RepID=A0A9P5Z980_9AGAR|nr:hypothetical protein BDN70DRAFT_873933 [Pholiota conissans]
MPTRGDSNRGMYSNAVRRQSSSRGPRGWRRGAASDTGSKPRTSQADMSASRPPVSGTPTSHRRMDLMASVSRSSGLEKDGDDLKNFGVQEEYREFIREKTSEVVEMFTRRTTETADQRRQRIDKQENLLILFRKLREGVSSSSRQDDFALEVYQTSLYYSIIFESPKQTTSIHLHLLPARSSKDLKSNEIIWPSPSICSILGSLLHHLVAFYPSQSAYHQYLASVPERLLPRNSNVSTWLLSLTKSLRRRDYARFAILSQTSNIIGLLDSSRDRTMGDENPPARSSMRYEVDGLATSAVLFLVDALRKKASDTSWRILRSAYRELWCDQAYPETKTWLKRNLTLESINPNHTQFNIEPWFEEKLSLGEIRKKEGTEGRWIVCKAS